MIISVWFGYTYVTLPAEPTEVTYVGETSVFTNDSQELTVQYDESADAARVTYDDNQYELARVQSASGTRYQSGNGLVVFTEHQGEARLEIGGDTVLIGRLVRTESNLSEDTSVVETVEHVRVESIEVVDVPVLGQRCVDSATVDCAALEAAAAGQ